MERTQLQENKRDLAVLVGLRSPVLREDSTDEESLRELAALVDTAGGRVVGSILQSREKPDPHSFIGEGKVEEVKTMVAAESATLVIFDNDLSPSQIRVLTELLGVQVIDRSGLILDIFAQRAKTKEGCLQVELAQYQYLLPRLIGMWTHLERQAGTSGKGPIGSKGPGETQLETDRRHIHRKIDKLKEELEYADLLLHVIDLSNPQWPQQVQVVDSLIRELKADHIPCLRVYNKCDLAFSGRLPREEDSVYISAKTGEGVDDLLRAIDEKLDKGTRRVTIHLPYDKAGLLDGLYREAKVESVEYEQTITVVAVCPPKVLGQMQPYIEGWTPPKEEWE